jgi:hypothetical protein
MAAEYKENRVNAAVSLQRELSQRLRPFAITYTLLSLPRIVKILGKKGGVAYVTNPYP